MHHLKSRTLGIVLGAAALGGLAVGLGGAASASAVTLAGGGNVSGWVSRRDPGTARPAQPDRRGQIAPYETWAADGCPVITGP